MRIPKGVNLERRPWPRTMFVLGDAPEQGGYTVELQPEWRFAAMKAMRIFQEQPDAGVTAVAVALVDQGVIPIQEKKRCFNLLAAILKGENAVRSLLFAEIARIGREHTAARDMYDADGNQP